MVHPSNLVRRAAATALLALVLFGGGSLLGRSAVHAAFTVRWVNINGGVVTPPGLGCMPAGYLHIQDAVNAANPGDRINVCAGTYVEQVIIAGAGKNGISLTSTIPRGAIIQAPASFGGNNDTSRRFQPVLSNDLVTISGAQGVSISRFVIRGPIPAGNACGLGGDVVADGGGAGVSVVNGASATVAENYITQMLPFPASSCDGGRGVFVHYGGSATIQGNFIDTYQLAGVEIDGELLLVGVVGTAATVTGNYIYGTGGSSPASGQFGIVVLGRNATLDASYNHIYNNVASGNGIGIVAQFGPSITATGNTLIGNEDGLDLLDGLASATITGNYAQGNRIDGMFIGQGVFESQASNHGMLTRNLLFSNGVFGIDVDTGGNTFTSNIAFSNPVLDCLDETTGGGTAGTANTWIGNQGSTSFPAGICSHNAVSFGVQQFAKAKAAAQHAKPHGFHH